jgi:uncharacterized membrane protein
MPEIPRLLLGTVVLRPYVFTFLLIFLVGCTLRYGTRVTLLHLVSAYLIAFLSEYSSIHNGFPYGHYYYIPTTADRELWIAGVPFMDSLSYVFLSFAAYRMAVLLESPLRRRGEHAFLVMDDPGKASLRTILTGALLFTFLDVVVDPAAFLGDRWFLGKIYGYRHEGWYFHIPWTNFAGWFLVGLVLMTSFRFLLRRYAPCESRSSRGALSEFSGPLLYWLVITGNLGITFWIGEPVLGLTGLVLSGLLLIWSIRRISRNLKEASPA